MSKTKLLKTIKDNQRFLISSHVNPDPDALCSEMAMAGLLKAMGKKVTIVNEHFTMNRFHFLPGVKSIKPYKGGMKVAFDVLVVLDCGELDRIGPVKQLIKPETTIINIDHHITNDKFGHINHVLSDASSTAEVLYDLFKYAKIPLTQSLAKLLYVGIMTDTGSFRYDNTTAKTHRIVSDLMSHGFSAFKIYRELYESIPVSDMLAFTKVIERFEVHHQSHVITIDLPKSIQNKFSEDFDLKDMIFKFLRTIKDVEAYVIFTEVSENETRVNFRSSGTIDVAHLASEFGGGGHRNASGCVVSEKMSTTKQLILSKMKRLPSWKEF